MARILLVTLTTATAAVLVTFLVHGARDASANTFTVTSGADPGNGVCDAICTLREALDEANATPGHDVINFDPAVFPPGVPAVISPATALPASTDEDGITIDGSSAGVAIDGSGLAGSENGLVVQSSSPVTPLSDVTIRSVTIQNFPGSGIYVCGGQADACEETTSDVLVEDVASNGNGDSGVSVRGATSVTGVEVRESTTNGNGFSGISVAGGMTANTLITDVTSSNNGGGGIGIGAVFGDTIDVEVRNAVTNSNDGPGVHICCFDIIRPTIANVSSNDNRYENISVIGERISDATIRNCEANGSRIVSGIEVIADITNLDISDCEANDNARIGVEVIAFDQSRKIDGASIADVTSQDNGDTGIHVEATESSVTDLLIDHANASGNGNNGVFVRGGESVTDVHVRNSTSNRNDFQGTTVAGGINTRTVITNVTSSNNGEEGIAAAGFITDLVDTTIESVVTNSNGSEGMYFCCFDMIRTLLTNVTSMGNLEEGINFVGERVVDGTVTGCKANGSQLFSGIGVTAEIENLTVSDCETSDNAEQGIWLWAYSPRTIDGVAISNVRAANNGTHGFEITPENEVSNVSLVSNTFTDNASSGIEAGGPVEAHFNRIFGNGVGVNNLAGATLDVENNWWGCNGGPTSPECDSTAASVDADPWLTLSLASDPDPAFAKSIAEITASLTTNSDDADTSGPGHIQDGTAIEFTTSGGSLSGVGTSVPTVSGKAIATLHSENEGVVQLTATLDNATVELALMVLESTATATPTASPALELVQGDNDCDGDVDAVDALQGLRFVAGLGVSQAAGCPGLGTEVASLFGDVDCDGDVDAVDALQILRFVAGLAVNQQQACPQIGEALS